MCVYVARYGVDLPKPSISGFNLVSNTANKDFWCGNNFSEHYEKKDEFFDKIAMFFSVFFFLSVSQQYLIFDTLSPAFIIYFFFFCFFQTCLILFVFISSIFFFCLSLFLLRLSFLLPYSVLLFSLYFPWFFIDLINFYFH